MNLNVSDVTSELANRIVRSGIDDVTSHSLYPVFALSFQRDSGTPPGVAETPWGDVHDVFHCVTAPDVY